MHELSVALLLLERQMAPPFCTQSAYPKISGHNLEDESGEKGTGRKGRRHRAHCSKEETEMRLQMCTRSVGKDDSTGEGNWVRWHAHAYSDTLFAVLPFNTHAFRSAHDWSMCIAPPSWPANLDFKKTYTCRNRMYAQGQISSPLGIVFSADHHA